MISALQSRPEIQNRHNLGKGEIAQVKKSKNGDREAIWVPMLNNASQDQELPQKQLIVLGGTSDQQNEFLQSIKREPVQSRYQYRHQKPREVPVSNRYALGYTYQDVLDEDGEDVLARLSIYMLASPSASCAPLLRPLFQETNVADTLVTILLDWGDPFAWPRLLRQWIRLLRSLMSSLDDKVRDRMNESMMAWKEKRAGSEALATHAGVGTMDTKASAVLPLGPGEWEEELGVPLSVICLNADKTERMEKDFGWQDDEFDFVSQWMRTVLLKHGASIAYTTSYEPNSVRQLLHSILGIQSLLRKEVVKPDIINRDKLLVPPNWDSWGKIRILKEGFEIETIAKAWSIEIHEEPEQDFSSSVVSANLNGEPEIDDNSAVSIFEASLPNPMNGRRAIISSADESEVTVPDTQTFLAAQLQFLDKLRLEDQQSGRRSGPGDRRVAAANISSSVRSDSPARRTKMNMEETIGPYQINVGGIQVDAEEVTRRLRERVAATESASDSSQRTPTKAKQGSKTPATDKNDFDPEAAKNFFADLMRKSKNESTRGSRGGSAAPSER